MAHFEHYSISELLKEIDICNFEILFDFGTLPHLGSRYHLGILIDFETLFILEQFSVWAFCFVL